MEEIKNILKTKLSVVLVNPIYSGNIGSSARAMQNMGISRLSLVNPVDFLNNSAFEMACNAKEILLNASVHTSLEDAVAASGVTVGASRRVGKSRPSFMEYEDGINKIASMLESNHVSIIFGTEKNGLTNDELKYCQHKIAIPADEDFGSLNLSQSVLIFCYEIRKALFALKGQSDKRMADREFSPSFMPAADLEFMYKSLRKALIMLGYAEKPDKALPDNAIQSFRRIFSRSGIELRDYKLIMGLCSQVRELYGKTGEKNILP